MKAGRGPLVPPNGARLADLLSRDNRPILRWRVLDSGKLVHAFPGHQAPDEEAARALAKKRLGHLWFDRFTIEAIK